MPDIAGLQKPFSLDSGFSFFFPYGSRGKRLDLKNAALLQSPGPQNALRLLQGRPSLRVPWRETSESLKKCTALLLRNPGIERANEQAAEERAVCEALLIFPFFHSFASLSY